MNTIIIVGIVLFLLLHIIVHVVLVLITFAIPRMIKEIEKTTFDNWKILNELHTEHLKQKLIRRE